MSSKWLIYKHTCIESNKSYIGMTKHSMEQRWKEHVYASNTKNNNNHFHNAIKLYGINAWISTVIADGIEVYEDAQEMEKYYIKKYDTFENGYNTTYGGEGVNGYVYSEKELIAMTTERRARKGNKLYSFYNPELQILENDIHPMDFAAKYGILPGNVWYVVNNKSYQAEGWYLWKGNDHEYINKVQYELEHEKYGYVKGTLTELAKIYTVCRKALARVLHKKVIEYNGWTLPGNQHLIAECRKYKYVTAYSINTNEELCIYPSVAAAANAYKVTPKVIKSRCQGTINIALEDVMFKYTYKEN